jgi:hypothetical protein
MKGPHWAFDTYSASYSGDMSGLPVLNRGLDIYCSVRSICSMCMAQKETPLCEGHLTGACPHAPQWCSMREQMPARFYLHNLATSPKYKTVLGMPSKRYKLAVRRSVPFPEMLLFCMQIDLHGMHVDEAIQRLALMIEGLYKLELPGSLILDVRPLFTHP